MALNRIFVACGDPNGVGPEVSLKALSILPEEIRSRAVLAGPFQVLTELNRLIGEPLKLVAVQSIGEANQVPGVPVLELQGARPFYPSYGRVTADAGMIAGRGIMWGASACLKGEAGALVTAPICKEALQLAGFHYPGQTEMLASLAGSKRHIMILASEKLRVGIATTHVALRSISALLQRELILDKIVALHEGLKSWFGVAEPHIGVAALNPHASDGGIFGKEESRVISPAIEEARGLGIQADGPFPADTLFPRWKNFDGLLAMYHDQGMIPIKMAAFGEAINLTSGLPFARTSPDHGTAFDIAGKMIADPKSMIKAIQTAYEFSLAPGKTKGSSGRAGV